MLGSDVEQLLRKKSVEFVSTDLDVDISNYDSLVHFSKNKPIDWIVNCAAYTDVDGAEDDAESSFKINAQGPRNISKIAHVQNLADF